MRAVIPFDLEMQDVTHTPHWCWAAVAVSVARYYNNPRLWTQCDVVCQQLNNDTCCAQPPPLECDLEQSLRPVLKRMGHFDYFVDGPVSFADCVAAIRDEKRPLPIRVEWQDGAGGHFIVVHGVDDEDGERLSVLDPWTGGPVVVPHAVVLNSYQNRGQWTHTYYTK
jgi:hypothetical protein